VAAILTVAGLSKRYGKASALDSVSFELGRGRCSPCSARTARQDHADQCVIGLVHFEGRITLDGSMCRAGKQARRLIGYLAQNPALHTDLTYGRRYSSTPT